MERGGRPSAGSAALKAVRLLCLFAALASAVYLAWWGWNSYQSFQASKALSNHYTSMVTVATPPPAASSDGSGGNERAAQHVVDFTALQTLDPEILAWVRVSGIDVIDYPVVQHADDTYYLTHAADLSEDRYGAIFLEAQNAADFSDLHTIVYGHNMKDGSMFGSLKKYEKQQFYEKNGGIVYLDTPNGSAEYQIFSVEYVSPTAPEVYSIGFTMDDTYEEFLQTMKKNSLYDTGVEVSKADHVLTLSTCSNHGTRRFVVHAKLLEE